MEEEARRPISVTFACLFFAVFFLLGLMRLVQAGAPTFPLQARVVLFVATLACLAGLWRMKRAAFLGAMLGILISCFLIAVDVAQIKGASPVGEFFKYAFPFWLLYIACTWPHRQFYR